jgi:hypothetical protein
LSLRVVAGVVEDWVVAAALVVLGLEQGYP